MLPQRKFFGAHGGRFASTSSAISCPRAPRIVAPVVGIDLLAHRDIAKVLRDFQRTHLVGGIRRFVDGVGRPHQYRLDAELALEQPLRQVQLDFEIALRNVR